MANTFNFTGKRDAEYEALRDAWTAAWYAALGAARAAGNKHAMDKQVYYKCFGDNYTEYGKRGYINAAKRAAGKDGLVSINRDSVTAIRFL